MALTEERKAYMRANYAKNREHLLAYRRNKPVPGNKPDTMVCRACGVEKPYTEEFFRKQPTMTYKLTYHCKTCLQVIGRSTHARLNFGLTLEEADAKRSLPCEICGTFRKGKTPGTTMHIDHCHSTGKIRGTLCGHCNHALGNMKDNPERLRAAADYLEKYRGQ